MRRPFRPLALLAAGPVLALLATSNPARATTTPSTSPAAGASHLLATPILSARRDPTWVDDTLADQRLDRSLDTATAGLDSGPKSPSACVLATSAGGQLYALDPSTELIPASNLKLITATAALNVLGPSDQETTTVKASAAPRGGTVTGNLYLLGGGDPYLLTDVYNSRIRYPDPSYTSLDRLAASVRAAGVTTVTGSVVGDGSRYDAMVGVPTWSPQYLAEGDVGPLSALEVNDGMVPPADPATSALPAGPMPLLPAPTLYAAQIFTALLKAHGVKVTGPAATGRTPAAAPTVTRVESAPLSATVEQMLRVSDDTAAELLTKELGYHDSGQGTTQAGTAVIRRAAAAAGLPVDQLVQVDGSGLDTEDRVTCNLIVDALQRAGTTGVIAAGLPIAGKTGTLTDRMKGTAAVGRLHAKTGTLEKVSALSGFVDGSAGAPTPQMRAPLYFSIIINGMDSGLAAPLADRIGAAIASYPDAVPLAALEPGA